MNSRLGLLFTAFIFIFGATTSWAVRPEPSDSSVAHDFAPDEDDSTIIARIAQIDSDMDIVFNAKVRVFIDYFTIRHRDYMRKMLYREKAYFPMIEKALAAHDMPDDLKYLTIVESGLNPTAKSRAGALGMWQFMPSTGKMFKLNYDYYRDERMDPYKATDAACAYLKQLHSMFDDWEMALAAYNCGPGNVRRAIRKSGGKSTFWGIYDYLPRETRSYVPQFMAVNYAMRYANEHNLYVEDFMRHVAYDTLVVNQYFNVKEFAKESGICVDELNALNPELKRNVIPEFHKNYTLRIPSYAMPKVEKNMDKLMASAKIKGPETLVNKPKYPASQTTEGKSKYVHTVRSGDVLGSIAQRYHVKISDVKIWNNLHSNTIYAGQKLSIYKNPAYFKKEAPKQQAVAAAKPSKVYPGKTHTVQPGDTLWKISRQYEGLTIDKIKQLNNLATDNLKPGQKLKLG